LVPYFNEHYDSNPISLQHEIFFDIIKPVDLCAICTLYTKCERHFFLYKSTFFFATVFFEWVSVMCWHVHILSNWIVCSRMTSQFFLHFPFQVAAAFDKQHCWIWYYTYKQLGEFSWSWYASDPIVHVQTLNRQNSSTNDHRLGS